jgi:hypothetical protein
LPKPLDAVANMPADLDLANMSDDEIEQRLAALKARKAELEARKAELERNIDAAIPGHKHLSNWNDYAFDCPEGTWTARLEQLAWGKSTNLILCFADVLTGKQYRLSVLSGTRYKPRDGSHDFRHDAAPGDVFELTTKKTKNGNPDLKSARLITRAATEQS